ncbi:protein CHUP1, chloroplastic-like [Solanum stenotomum]|uniref:protein CHUP1, chloroplastic-like n=1 Tax=Solanum stenotomum TaxID=172797 RepID=UPI0020D1E921|nr:protein CHUP1, chloroplastic-like [Solanum stenotomum]
MLPGGQLKSSLPFPMRTSSLRPMRNIFSSLPFLLWKIVKALKQESLQLRKQNQELVKEVDHIQEGRCSDVDEVAYLKWINACLRYELRNYQSALGETTARDLSKSLSPESSKKAKQLVVEYAAKKDQGDKGIHVLELDSNQLSSQEPHLMNSDTRAIKPQSRSRIPSPGSSKQSIDFHSFDQGSTANKGESKNYPTRTKRYSDAGSLDYMSKRLAESPQEKGNNHDQEDVHKAELAKYAEVLKGSL